MFGQNTIPNSVDFRARSVQHGAAGVFGIAGLGCEQACGREQAKHKHPSMPWLQRQAEEEEKQDKLENKDKTAPISLAQKRRIRRATLSRNNFKTLRAKIKKREPTDFTSAGDNGFHIALLLGCGKLFVASKFIQCPRLVLSIKKSASKQNAQFFFCICHGDVFFKKTYGRKTKNEQRQKKWTKNFEQKTRFVCDVKNRSQEKNGVTTCNPGRIGEEPRQKDGAWSARSNASCSSSTRQKSIDH